MEFNVFEIITWVKRRVSKRDLLIGGGVFALFLLTRLFRLDSFPIFSDEGIYIHWAKVAWKDASWRFISLTDGRQPLQTWGTIPFLKLFESNALLAGRLFAVTGGTIAFTGIAALAGYLFNSKKAALIAAILYIVSPYFLFYDRLAIVDSTVTGGVIWILFLSILLARTRRADVAFLLGGVMGLTMLGKSSVRLYIMGAFLAVVYIVIKKVEGTSLFQSIRDFFTNKEETAKNVLNFTLLYGLSVCIALFMYNVQRLSPFFHYVSAKNTTFVLTGKELLANPLALLPSNLWRIPYYISSELGYVIFGLSLVGLFFLYKKQRNTFFFVTGILLLVYFILGSVARVLYPRYVQALGAILLLPATYAVLQIKDRKKTMLVMLGVVASILYFDYTILFSHKNIPFPEVDRGQYLEGWPAGWGTKEIVEMAREESKTRPVILLAEGSFGMVGDVLDTHLKPGDTIQIKSYWPLTYESLTENAGEVKTKSVYAVFAHRTEFPTDWPIELVKKYDKPGDTADIYLYKLIEPKQVKP